jgi:hypothetical protein
MVFPHVGHFIREKVRRSQTKVKRERPSALGLIAANQEEMSATRREESRSRGPLSNAFPGFR